MSLTTIGAFASNYTVTRYAAGTHSNTTGRFTPGSTSTLTIRASVQPASPSDVERLPEGMRGRDARRVYTETQLFPVRQGAQPRQADTLVIDGYVYEVADVNYWDKVMPHYRCIAVRRPLEGT